MRDSDEMTHALHFTFGYYCKDYSLDDFLLFLEMLSQEGLRIVSWWPRDLAIWKFYISKILKLEY